MFKSLKQHLQNEITAIREAGLYKSERIILSDQKANIKVKEGEVLNFCANNYLGLANNPEIIAAAKKGMDERGYGLSSVRFICGTQDIHKQLEKKVCEFMGTEDTILYSSCFDANGGFFENIFNLEQDAIISDELNHASIIDGVRLSKAQRFRYKNANMDELKARLEEAKNCRFKVICTDGVFSMDGIIAPLDKICDLADQYDALVFVDDSHATGFIGKTGRGTPEHCGVLKRVDIVSSTLGKALGGASGGYTTGRAEIIEFLRQRSRPYLFSNTLAPSLCAGAIATFNMLMKTTALRDKLENSTKYFRDKMGKLGFNIVPGVHPIVPVMLGDAKLASQFADEMLKEGIYVIGFSYPVVPKDKARIRTQISAAHEMAHLDKAINAFTKVGRKLNVIK
ncbi:MAG: glycine C-acetyltransferase [Planctomycetes bacterium]|nr:glycine C-acetyltransferase [Planctomycetota bacterium]